MIFLKHRTFCCQINYGYGLICQYAVFSLLIYMCVCACVCIYICIYMCVYRCVCIYIYLCVCVSKEMFYLMTHSRHFILRLYGVRHMVKDHSDSEIGNLLLPHGLLFLINTNSNGSFICTNPQTG